MVSGGSSTWIVGNGFVAMLVGSLLLLAASAASAAQLTLNWVDNSGGTATFAIERTTATTGTYTQIATTGAGATTYTDPNVVAGTTYCYRVKASTVSGDSGYSNEACATFSQSNGTASGPAPAITGSVGTVTVGDTLTATWSNFPSPSPTDWIGLFQPGAPDTAYIDWIYVSCSKTAGPALVAGSCSFAIPSTLPLGTYELRLLANDGFTRLATSASLIVASAPLGSDSPGFVNALGDPNYKEGFGANVTGGAGKPVCTVTSSAATGAGTFDACFDINIGGNAGAQNKTIQFAVSSFTTNQRHVLGSNTSIDGCANGQNGVTYTQGGPGFASTKNALLIQDPVDNVLIRCINFRSTGAPNSEATDPNAAADDNFIWLDPENGQTISNVLVDRCTFFQATNKAFDITGSGGAGTIRNVTFQRNLVTDGALNTLIKYADGTTLIKHSISLHHNVYAHGGERQIAQVRDTIGQANGPVDIVNNVAYLASNYYQTNYPDGSQVDPYTLRFWNTTMACQTPTRGCAAGSVDPSNGDSTAGNITANVVANAFLGDRAVLEVRTDGGASEAGIYISADNVWTSAGTTPDSNHYQASRNPSSPGTVALPWHVPNAVSAQYQVTVLPVSQLASMLPYVGAPNRTPLDQQRLDDVAAVLP